MYTKNVFAAGALLSVVAAVPMVKRDVVWVTETDEAVVTVPVTTTVWVNPGESIPTASASVSHYGHHRSHVTTHVQSTVTVSSADAPASTEESSAPAPSSYVAPTTSTTEEAAPTTPSSTSVYVAPTTSSTSEYVAPTPTPSSTWVEPTTSSTSAAPAATSTASSGSGSGLTGNAASGTEYKGDLTWYDVGLGACGITSSPSDKIVAIAESLFDEYTPTSGIHAGNPNANTLCGKSVTITGTDGSPYTATIVDRCGGCAKADLDLSQDFFNAVTNNGDGRVHNMSWKFD